MLIDLTAASPDIDRQPEAEMEQTRTFITPMGLYDQADGDEVLQLRWCRRRSAPAQEPKRKYVVPVLDIAVDDVLDKVHFPTAPQDSTSESLEMSIETPALSKEEEMKRKFSFFSTCDWENWYSTELRSKTMTQQISLVQDTLVVCQSQSLIDIILDRVLIAAVHEDFLHDHRLRIIIHCIIAVFHQRQTRLDDFKTRLRQIRLRNNTTKVNLLIRELMEVFLSGE